MAATSSCRNLVLLAALLAVAGVVSATQNPTPQSTHVMARIELDNTVKEVNKSLPTLKKQIAKELCVVPESAVTIVKVMDDSTKVAGIGNTQTVVYAACKAPNSKLEAVRDDCEDLWNRHQVKDETKDSTSWWKGGELEVDDIDCRYVENNKWDFFSKADKKKAVEQAAAAVKSGAGALPAAAAGLLLSAAAAALL